MGKGSGRGRIPYEEERALQMQFGMWLGLPANCRQDDEQTQLQFAEKYNLREETLSRWKKNSYVIEVANNAIKVWGGNRKMDVMNAIINDALNGKAQAQRLYMEMMGEVGSKTKETPPTEFKLSFNTKEK